MAAGRDPAGPRKGFTPDSRGIHWGIGKRHESGKPWDPDEWERFVAWAIGDGALPGYKDAYVAWRDGDHLLHRPDGPAVIEPGGYEEWWLNGELHRPDGPAVICADGHKEWWLDGTQYTDETFTVEFAAA